MVCCGARAMSRKSVSNERIGYAWCRLLREISFAGCAEPEMIIVINYVFVNVLPWGNIKQMDLAYNADTQNYQHNPSPFVCTY
jgi:hypothetical protein